MAVLHAAEALWKMARWQWSPGGVWTGSLCLEALSDV